MSDDTALVVRESSFLAPAATLQELNERYVLFNNFIAQQLKEGIDYATIPGASKPSLWKPGAEKLGTLFALTPKFILSEQEKDWTGEQHSGEPFFYFAYRCELYRNDRLVASCDGSCNSWEVKYRYRQQERVCPKCGQKTIIKGKDEYGGGWLCWAKKGGCGSKFTENDPAIISQRVGRIPNQDIADIVNTLQKMAQKRAFIGAILIATNSSERFTQDIEDMSGFGDVVDGNFSVDEPKKHEPPKQQKKPNQNTLIERLNAIGILLWHDQWEKVKKSIGEKYGGDVERMLKWVEVREKSLSDDKALIDHIAKSWPGMERTLPLLRKISPDAKPLDVLAGVVQAVASKSLNPKLSDQELADIVLAAMPEEVTL